MAELKPCLWCSGRIEIIICDDEGNIHNADYEKAPYSGICYGLSHHFGNVPGGEGCPIATHRDDILGATLYDTREEAITAWNTRAEPEPRALTVEELSTMGGMPIYIFTLRDQSFSQWRILDKLMPVDFYLQDVNVDNGDCYATYEYGETWLAYDRQPKGE